MTRKGQRHSAGTAARAGRQGSPHAPSHLSPPRGHAPGPTAQRTESDGCGGPAARTARGAHRILSYSWDVLATRSSPTYTSQKGLQPLLCLLNSGTGVMTTARSRMGLLCGVMGSSATMSHMYSMYLHTERRGRHTPAPEQLLPGSDLRERAQWGRNRASSHPGRPHRPRPPGGCPRPPRTRPLLRSGLTALTTSRCATSKWSRPHVSREQPGVGAGVREPGARHPQHPPPGSAPD